jgi:hypothetical protein
MPRININIFRQAKRNRRDADEHGKEGEDLGRLVSGISDPRGLSVDWVARNLYYIEGDTASVRVVSLNTRARDGIRKCLRDAKTASTNLGGRI